MGTMEYQKDVQECRPNYEKMIHDMKNRRQVCAALYDATKEFLRKGSGLNRAWLMDMLGHLDMLIDGHDRGIAELISRQESQSDKESA